MKKRKKIVRKKQGKKRERETEVLWGHGKAQQGKPEKGRGENLKRDRSRRRKKKSKQERST